MDTLSGVSETALITLRARVIESQKEQPVIHDKAGVELLERIRSRLPTEVRQRVLDMELRPSLARHIALRARKYDSYAREFIQQHPRALVVSLGCGFDTRYWRVSDEPWRYIEVDLAEVIAFKKQLLADPVEYPMIGCSVLEDRWIEEIRAIQDQEVLFLAEGLFMYLPKQPVEHLFHKLSETFTRSQIVFEVVTDKYTRGLWKKLVESKIKRATGTGAGSSYQFGLREAQEIESYGKHIRVMDEWSYFEDPDIKPGFLRLFRHMRAMTRAQWTIRASIG